MNKHNLRGLYAITDDGLMAEKNFSIMAEQALLGGARLIQYRDKTDNSEKRLQQATILKKLCEQTGSLLIINDDINLANSVQAHGVHLGKDDMSIEQARQHLPANSIIGISCYDQLDLALAAEKAGANYVAFGAFFTSPTKPDANTATLELLKQAKQQLQLPICCIGGITLNNASTLIEQGADMTAIITDLFSRDDIQASASQFSRLFG